MKLQTNGDFSEEKLQTAILYVQDLLDKCQIPFVVLGNIAYQMRHGLPLHDHRVIFGVLENHAVIEQTRFITEFEPRTEVRTDGWRIVYGDVPVMVKILTKRYDVIINPDIVFYHIEFFHIPNPWEEYWKIHESIDV